MRYFLDCEFYERPGHIDLISIGIVSEDGREFYAENSSFLWDRLPRGDSVAAATPNWLRANVKPHLVGGVALTPPEGIRQGILEFVDASPEFWGYFADYDWVVFCWIFGSMIDLPQGFPMYCRDIKQLADSLGNPALPEQEGAEHNALEDARWNRRAWKLLHEHGGGL